MGGTDGGRGTGVRKEGYRKWGGNRLPETGNGKKMLEDGWVFYLMSVWGWGTLNL